MSKIYVGETPISAVFMGGKRYGMRVGYDRLLPAGYTQLEYIEATGTQYIDTGITASYSIGVVADFQYTALSSGQSLFQVYSGSAASWMITVLMMTNYSAVVDEMSFYSTYYPTYGTKIDTADLDRHSLSFNKNNDYTVFFDGIAKSIEPPQRPMSSATATMCLFARKSEGGGTNEYAKMKLYSCSMYNSGVLVRDFIPAKRDSDGKIGLYDTVSKTFFTDANGGNFVGGDPV